MKKETVSMYLVYPPTVDWSYKLLIVENVNVYFEFDNMR